MGLAVAVAVAGSEPGRLAAGDGRLGIVGSDAAVAAGIATRKAGCAGSAGTRRRSEQSIGRGSSRRHPTMDCRRADSGRSDSILADLVVGQPSLTE